MRFCFYRRESNINRLYNDTVDRTEAEIQQMHAKTTQASLAVGARATLGKIFEFFGLPDLSASVDAKLQRELASHKAVVLRLAPEPKQRIIEARRCATKAHSASQRPLKSLLLKDRHSM
jgi:hypothetical protein